MKHDAIDSLIYLHRGLPLAWVIETIQDRFGDENGEVNDIVDALSAAMDAIRHEAELHHDGRREYSNGVPFERAYKFPASEPGDHGDEVPVISEAWLQMNPGNPERQPPHGGVWKV